MARNRRIRPGPSNPDQHALQLAEAVDQTWHGHHGHGDIAIPLSTVAALALLTPPYAERHAVACEWMDHSVEEFAKRIRGLWNWVIVTRPDLANAVWPLMSVWQGERELSESELRCAKHVADAVLSRDLISLTGTQMKLEVDLLGAVLTVLRSPSAWQSRGQYYTPASIADMMASILGVAEGESVNDPSCGTGGMLRAAAQAMRGAGRDPHQATWVGTDIDQLATAACAVNAIIWDLGPRVLIACGDTLKWDGFFEEAVAARNEMIRLSRQLHRDRAMLDMFKLLGESLDEADTEQAADPDLEQPEPAPEPAAPDPVSEPDSEPAGDPAAVDNHDEDDTEPSGDGPLVFPGVDPDDFWDLVDRAARAM
jgi:hypothetical protein